MLASRVEARLGRPMLKQMEHRTVRRILYFGAGERGTDHALDAQAVGFSAGEELFTLQRVRSF
jgi:hypothetical protein